MELIQSMKYDLLNQFSDDTAFHEMAQIGVFDAYVVWVGTDDEGIVPHFHVWDADTAGEVFHTCIQLEKAAYFHHTGKEDAFDSNSIEALCRFLRSPSVDEPEKTNWQVLVIEWNRNNPTRKVEKDSQMPDYQLLEKKMQ